MTEHNDRIERTLEVARVRADRRRPVPAGHGARRSSTCSSHAAAPRSTAARSRSAAHVTTAAASARSRSRSGCRWCANASSRRSRARHADAAPTPVAAPAATRAADGAPGAAGARPASGAADPGAQRTTPTSAPAPTPATTSERAPASAELPIPGYDALSASQVVERLAGLAAPELDAVRAYEATHRNRRTILGKIDQLSAYGRVMEAARAATAGRPPALVELAHELRAELRDDARRRAVGAAASRRVRAARRALAELMLARDDAIVVVGTIDDVVVGYGTLEFETLRDGARLGVIGDIYVEPEARGGRRGGGGRRPSSSRSAARPGCTGIDAFALPGHRQAKNFFERVGFTARALVMHKPLPPADA